MQKRCAIYARFSTDLQRDESIDDQIRLVSEYIAKQPGWTVVEVFTDYAISGSTEARPGFQNLIAAAKSADKPFDMVVSEALDRLSRNQAGIATLYQDLEYLNIGLCTVAEGMVSKLHIGLTGTMNALQLEQIAIKTKRGQQGRLEQGKIPGGKAYGYDIANTVDHRGQLERGGRTINEEEADVVRRIFREYVEGSSPKAIAHRLNEQGVKGPRGDKWLASTINGNKARQTGILFNPLYIGEIVWNRQSWKKDPRTGKRRSVANPISEWRRKSVPELRIIDQKLWEAAQRKKSKYAGMAVTKRRRAHRVLSGLIKCGVCGGNMVIVHRDRYGCGTRRNEGLHTCTNNHMIARTDVENRVFDGLRQQLAAPHLVKLFVTEYTAAINNVAAQKDGRSKTITKRIAQIDRELSRFMQKIAEGLDIPEMHAHMTKLSEEKKAMEAELASLDSNITQMHPNAAMLYHKRIQTLQEKLTSAADDASRMAAAELIRTLVEEIRVLPGEKKGQNTVEITGDLAGILSMAFGSGAQDDDGASVVAAGGFGEFSAGIKSLKV